MIRQLWLDHNALDTLPPSIGRCVTLEELNLDHNNLKSLPMSICQVRNMSVRLSGYK